MIRELISQDRINGKIQIPESDSYYKIFNFLLNNKDYKTLNNFAMPYLGHRLSLNIRVACLLITKMQFILVSSRI